MHPLTPPSIQVDPPSNILKRKLIANAVSNSGPTGLHYAILNNAIYSNSPKIIKQIINNGADVNAIDNDGDTLLHCAINKDHPNLEIIKLLIIKGANLNAIDNDGDTPLHCATKADSHNLEIIKLLIKGGANLKAINNKGQSCSWLIKAKEINLSVDFDEYDKEFELRKLVANSWSINKKSQFNGKTFPLSGGYDRIARLKTIELLQSFKEQLSPVIDLEKTYKLIKKVYKKTIKNKPEKISKQFRKGKALSIPTGWQGHSILVLFFEDYMLVVNRGEKRHTSSIKAFKISRTKNLNIKQIVKLLHHDNFSANKGAKFIYKKLPISLGYDSSQPDIISTVIEEKCQQSNQKMGNCWWLSIKSGILGILIIQNLLKRKSQLFESEKERIKNYEQIAANSLAIYKYYSKFSSITLLKEYIKRPANGVERDHLLVKLVVDKINSKKRKYLLKRLNTLQLSFIFLGNTQNSNMKKTLPSFYKIENIDSWLAKYKKEFKLNEQFVPL